MNKKKLFYYIQFCIYNDKLSIDLYYYVSCSYIHRLLYVFMKLSKSAMKMIIIVKIILCLVDFKNRSAIIKLLNSEREKRLDNKSLTNQKPEISNHDFLNV